MSSASRPHGPDPYEAWQRHYERALAKRSRARRARRTRRVRRGAVVRIFSRRRRLLWLVVALAALYAAALAAAFIL